MARWLIEPQPPAPNWPIDAWERFRYACLVHGVAPLLHRKIGDMPWLEARTRDWLAAQYTLNGQRQLKFRAELQAILEAFAKHDLEVMPLKGAILSACIYPDYALRRMADLDLLIHACDFERSSRLLTGLGYEQDVVHWKHTEFIKPGNRRVMSTGGEHPDNPRRVELHCYCRESFGGPTIDLTGLLWSTAQRENLLDRPATLPRLEMLWLHLLVHATYHLWQGKGQLINLVDLWLLTPKIAAPGEVLAQIDVRYTYPALALLKRYFPPLLDEAITQARACRLSNRFRAWAESLDLVNGSYLNPKPPGLYFGKALRFSEGRPNEVLQAARFSLLPHPEELALDHPQLARSPFPWLAYFLLPLDWAKRLLKRA
jgi:hypothetical protein